ncbi:putative spermidine/putrescine transport system substrate-binding protein [Tistlia consotensis]|uniref:Putative spermidine/putrescine transport system substrate-binding protein n=1 Tax=Tistlia consotensis USBA 355 TaxID=560819 RepID=A0A1Y6B2V3_9PROT|nr:ABC transporter substrate-binding protein [Tistlia consotensis]SME88680.1 putative spermidine/putrescine transport system substrate-binding protein [Tistlia consotensis USBA 355]SNR25234.1 putative spermidine/putrescine transport system substrate-binding protein [Tistlia consotensis]
MSNLLKTTVLAVGLAAFVAGAAKAAEPLTVVSWGGAYTKSQVEAYHKPFTKKTGIPIVSADYNGGLAEIKAQVEANNVTWDVVDVELSDAVRGCDEGLLEPIDSSMLPPAPDGTPARQDFLPGTLTDCSVATIVWSTIYAYDATKFPGEKPKTIADFFDTKKFPGKRAMRKGPKVNLEFALMADGVPADKVYQVLSTPEGVDRAFKKLDTIKKDVIWWEAGAQPPQMLADGEVAMTTAYNGRIFNAVASEKKPFVIVWDGQVWDLDLWVIPKGAPHAKEALDFVKFSTDTQRLADQASWISYGPARKSSVPLIGNFHDSDMKMGPNMPTSPDNFKNALQNDFEFWADYQDQLNERFAAWLAQ